MNALSTLALVCSFGGAKPGCNTCGPNYPLPFPGGPHITAHLPCPPIGPPAQVLAAKFVLPAGMRVTAFPGSPGARAIDAGKVFAMRPGYVYRFELAGGGRSLYPEIEVRGTLVLRPGMVLLDHFVGLNFSERDLERAATGITLTKVIYLEDPLKAVPLATTADKPHEIPEDDETAAIKAAYENGRIVAVVRLGNRKPGDAELAQVAVPNTILFPGDQRLALPPSPPPLGWQGVPLFDPILGPKFPHEECFIDGGDTAPPLGVRDNGRLGGLTPTDTAAEFTVNDKRKVTTSNTVCICAPRFVVRRVEIGLIGLATTVKLEAGQQRVIPAELIEKVRPFAYSVRIKPAGLLAMIHPQIQRGTQKPDEIASRQGLRAVYQVESVRQVTGVIEPEEIQNSDEFLLTKDVDPRENVKVGDVVTFTLRYTNRTGKPATDLVISDSLSGRLEYVSGSTQSDRPVNVTATANEAGSVIVRFELPGTLQPGQGGVIKFQAKVR